MNMVSRLTSWSLKSQQETLTSSADGKYYALPVVIKARCGYHMFGRFLNKLENEDLYFIMKDFIIQNDDKDPNTHAFIFFDHQHHPGGETLSQTKNL
jgi:hypothetical protein